MKKRIAYWFYFLSFLSFQMVHSQVENKNIKAKINLSKIEGALSVSGAVENLKSEYTTIFYKLSVFRKNIKTVNTSNTVQEGRLSIEPLGKVILSNTAISSNGDDQLIFLLLIYDEDSKLIAKDRIEINNQVKLESLVPRSGLEINGIISNDTKTKMGNEFYETFFSEFTKLQINSTKIILVQEELTIGRTTKIQVTIDGDIIEEFIIRPDEEFLKFMAEQAAVKTFKYFKNIEKQNKEISQY